MAGSVNKVILVGNLGKDPEARTFANGGKVVSFSLATSENWKDRASGSAPRLPTKITLFTPAMPLSSIPS